MTGLDIVRAAIPDASEQVADHVLWGRTPFPMGNVTARDLYRAASGFGRATAAGKQLCTFCHRIADANKYECSRCVAALASASGTEGACS